LPLEDPVGGAKAASMYANSHISQQDSGEFTFRRSDYPDSMSEESEESEEHDGHLGIF
jgi:hypothetical protein